MTLGEKIKIRMEQQHMSQNRLAKLAGISQSGLSSIVNGAVSPKENTIQSIAVALNCSATELMGEEPFVKQPETKEIYLLSIYRQLSEKGQDDLLAYAEFCLSRNPKQEKTTASAV